MTNTNVIQSYLQQTIAVTTAYAATTLTNSDKIWPTTPSAVKDYLGVVGQINGVSAKLHSLKVYIKNMAGGTPPTTLYVALGGTSSMQASMPFLALPISATSGGTANGIAMHVSYPISTLWFVDSSNKMTIRLKTDSGTLDVEGVQLCFELLG